MRKLGVGVLGVGEMGKRHAENLRRLVPEARLVAIADASAERARQVAAELEIENWHGSLEAMLERKDIDAVLIATPDKFNAQERRVVREAAGLESPRRIRGAGRGFQIRASIAGWFHAQI